MAVNKEVKKEFEKMRKEMRKQLASESSDIKFDVSKSTVKKKVKKAKPSSDLRKDFNRIKRKMEKTEKRLEKPSKPKKITKSKVLTPKPKKITKSKSVKVKHVKRAEPIVVKVSRKEVKDVFSRHREIPLSRRHTITKKEIKSANKILDSIRYEVGKVVIGQKEAIDELLMAMLCDGHVLVEGVPGIAKTLIIKALSTVTGCGSQRIQFTADLLPTDIVGVTTYEKSLGFKIIKGPIFTHFILADEINRASPKVQAALLEAMQERQVTIFKDTYSLPKPFFVMATQNPLESLGVYPLPQAQVDRFLFKVLMDYPGSGCEQKILMNNVTIKDFESYGLRSVSSPNDIIKIQNMVKRIHLNERMERYIINIVEKTRNMGEEGLGRFVQWGASPRGSIGIYIASKAAALLDGSDYVKPHHIKRVVHQVLRHRIILTYEGQAEEIDTDDIIEQIISKVSVP